MSYVYDKSGQSLFFVREIVYGEPYDPESELSAWTILPADYPHWRRFDKIPDTQEMDIPLIEKLKQFDIGDSKHASAILSGNISPIEFTLNMTAQGLEFLALAIGKPSLTSHDRKMVQTIICIDETAGVAENDYFLLDAIDASDNVKHFLIWFNDGTGSAPTVTGINASNKIEIDLSAGDKSANDIATLLKTALELKPEFTLVTVSGANAEITTVANAGAVQPVRNGAADPGFSYGVTTWGSTQYTLSEELTTSLSSFTIHAEQRNQDNTEDIIWDLFGCVVNSIEIRVAFEDKITTYTVTFSCPYALPNTNGKATNPPPRKNLLGFPTMEALQEGSGNYLIMENATTITDRTPKTVDSIVLTISNNVTFQSDVSKRHMAQAFSGKRDINMIIIGATQEKAMFTYWQEAYQESGGDYFPASANGRLFTTFKLQKDATYDYISIGIYGWLLKEHNFQFVSVDEAVKSVEMTFEDGSSNSTGRSINSFTMISYIDETVMIV